jgi:hypothetical protein
MQFFALLRMFLEALNMEKGQKKEFNKVLWKLPNYSLDNHRETDSLIHP